MAVKSLKCAECSYELIGTRQQNQQEEEEQRLNEGDREWKMNHRADLCLL